MHTNTDTRTTTYLINRGSQAYPCLMNNSYCNAFYIHVIIMCVSNYDHTDKIVN